MSLVFRPTLCVFSSDSIIIINLFFFGLKQAPVHSPVNREDFSNVESVEPDPAGFREQVPRYILYNPELHIVRC